jgi:hypothetical protein
MKNALRLWFCELLIGNKALIPHLLLCRTPYRRQAVVKGCIKLFATAAQMAGSKALKPFSPNSSPVARRLS